MVISIKLRGGGGGGESYVGGGWLFQTLRGGESESS